MPRGTPPLHCAGDFLISKTRIYLDQIKGHDGTWVDPEDPPYEYYDLDMGGVEILKRNLMDGVRAVVGESRKSINYNTGSAGKVRAALFFDTSYQQPNPPVRRALSTPALRPPPPSAMHVKGQAAGVVLPYHTIPYHTIPYHTIPYHTLPYHTIPYHTIPYHTIPYHTVPFHTPPPVEGQNVLGAVRVRGALENPPFGLPSH